MAHGWNILRRRLILRSRRQYLLARAIRRHRRLRPVADRTRQIGPRDILAFVTLRNERVRLPWFLDYYRRLGVGHFLVVDNASDDGSREYLAAQPDVSLWTTPGSYRRARFGMDWLSWLLFRYGTGHWCLTVDPDEFLVYPHCDTRPLAALCDWLDSSAVRSFPAMLLDLYPRGGLDRSPYAEGQDPTAVAAWFDPANYLFRKNADYGNLWIQGGPRARMFFADTPEQAPALNKIPLVRWKWWYVYVSSTHMLLPRSLNLVYDEGGGERASGILLHAKFLSTLIDKSAEEMRRGEHYAGSREYRAYHDCLGAPVDFWCEQSVRYEDWRQLDALGLISTGDWA